MQVATCCLAVKVSYQFHDDRLRHALLREVRDQRVAKHVETAQDLPFASFERPSEIVVRRLHRHGRTSPAPRTDKGSSTTRLVRLLLACLAQCAARSVPKFELHFLKSTA